MNNLFEWLDFARGPDTRRPWRRLLDEVAFAAAVLASIVLMIAITVVPWVIGVAHIFRSIFR